MSAVRGAIADRIYKISTRSAGYERGGPVRAEVEDEHNRLKNSGCRHLLILVHGFNNTASDAKNSYSLLLSLFEEHFTRSRYAPDAIAFFHWPGNLGPPVISTAGYAWDIRQADDSAKRLAEYLAAFPRGSDPGGFKITLIGHSLGCRLVLEMLHKLPRALVPNVEVVSLMAAAVPTEFVKTAGKLETTVRAPRRILKCYSHQDWVLWLAFPGGQLAASALNIEDEFYSEAVGLYGNPDLMGIPIKTANGHGDYWGDRNVANRFSAAIDPTFYTLPPAAQPAEWSLAPTSGISAWSLAGED
jgi:pimeloyl-ACP methyl ester carboxylesterase